MRGTALYNGQPVQIVDSHILYDTGELECKLSIGIYVMLAELDRVRWTIEVPEEAN